MIKQTIATKGNKRTERPKSLSIIIPIFICCMFLSSCLFYHDTLAYSNYGKGTFTYGWYEWEYNYNSSLGTVTINGDTVSNNGNQLAYGFEYVRIHIVLNREYNQGDLTVTLSGVAYPSEEYAYLTNGAVLSEISASTNQVKIKVRYGQEIELYITNYTKDATSSLHSLTSISISGANMSYTSTDNYYLQQINSALGTSNTRLNSILTQITAVATNTSALTYINQDTQNILQTMTDFVGQYGTNIDDIYQALQYSEQDLDGILQETQGQTTILNAILTAIQNQSNTVTIDVENDFSNQTINDYQTNFDTTYNNIHNYEVDFNNDLDNHINNFDQSEHATLYDFQLTGRNFTYMKDLLTRLTLNTDIYNFNELKVYIVVPLLMFFVLTLLG